MEVQTPAPPRPWWRMSATTAHNRVALLAVERHLARRPLQDVAKCLGGDLDLQRLRLGMAAAPVDSVAPAFRISAASTRSPLGLRKRHQSR